MEDYLTRKARYVKIARELIAKTTQELVNVMVRDEQPDLYFSLEDKIILAMNNAYVEGMLAGKREISEAIIEFDESQDQVDN